jgi:hypothetical protein
VPEFTATISKIGINPVIDPPDDALDAVFAAAKRNKGPIPVRGKINEAEFRQTLVRYGGKWRLYVNGEMCRAANAGDGDIVGILLEYDREPRVDHEPECLREALSGNKELREAFDALSPYRRREIIRYLASLKTEAAITRNIEKVLKQLTAK